MSTLSHHQQHMDHVRSPRSLSFAQPFVWLIRGWEDIWRTPAASLSYGLLVSFMGMLLIMMARHPYFLAAAITGFMLVGPLLTTGLCELSRRHTRGEHADFDSSLEGLARNSSALLNFALGLLVLSSLWFLVSTVMLTEIYGAAAPDFRMSTWAVWGELKEMMSADVLMSYMIVGGSLAVVVFAISVVAVPMMIDQQVSAGYAMRSSFKQTLAHLPTMILWAALITALVFVGFASFLFGLVVIFPLLGHATWHAYRDMSP